MRYSEHDRIKTISPVLRAGVGKTDITTEVPNRSIRDRLFAKALVLDDETTRIVLITLDATAIGSICEVRDEFLPQLRARVESELAIPGSHIAVNASHTHPPEPILCTHDQLVERTFQAVKEASESLCEVKVGAGRGYNDQITMNRNLCLKNGKLWTIRHTNPCPPEDLIAGIRSIDPEIGILRVDRLDGTPLAIVYNFASHLLFGDTDGSVTANFPGITSQIIEETLAFNTTAFFLQGAAGDIIDIGFKNLRQKRDMETLGQKLALSILEVLPRITTASGTLALIDEIIDLPRRTDSEQRIVALEAEQKMLLDSLRFTTLDFKTFLPLYLSERLCPEYPSHNIWGYLQEMQYPPFLTLREMDKFNQSLVSKYLQNIRIMERLAHLRDDLATYRRHQKINEASDSDTIKTEIQGIRIGEFVLLTAPIEILSSIGIALKKSSQHPHTYIAGFTNGYMHYGPPAEDYDRGSYEVTECFLAPEWQSVFESKAKDILSGLCAHGSFQAYRPRGGTENQRDFPETVR